ncbi:MAG: glycoside hydrolase family 3 C-terminal domain-containing protein, partial [Oscillospiraceae bacterium]|nr:glycoside hydrolase family 3 C-terminal domain-containing protein [Oscillospiraceae bacterium]
MNRIQKTFGRVVKRVMDRVMGAGLMQEENTPEGERYLNPGMPELIRQAAAESCVLLKNDGALPLNKKDEVAVFGRCQLDWFFVGYGSGGDVHPAYRRNLMDGLRLAGACVNGELAETYRAWTAEKANAADEGWWGHWPYSHPEMPLDEDLVLRAAQTAKTALVVIGRAAGEDRENTLTQGSYYLTELERDMLDAVTSVFSKTVVLLDTGSIMDMAWTEEYGDKLSALLLVWQGGMESGCAAADVLYGAVSPSGRLADTIARYYVDYPSAANFGGKEYNEYKEGVFVGYRYFEAKAPDCVLFPFGFGLSYTSFDARPVSFSHRETGVEVALKITNTGTRPGREVAQLWCHAPAEGLEKPLRVLAAFGKTRVLNPGESETVALSCAEKDFA